ncbi:MAG: S41 family peptidase [Defluviitaleaceae bacterium]|nr:S41 family peptidase [Defluviitaleaceae bacterium]
MKRKVTKIIVAMVLSVAMVISMVALVPSAIVMADTAPAATLDLVPIRQFFVEEVGAEVEWVHEYRAILITVDDTTIVLFANETHAYVNSVPMTLEHGVIMISNRAFITMDDIILLSNAADAVEMIVLELTEEARDIALVDFDYMIEFTLANSAWDNVLYRRLGINFEEHVAEHRYIIENMLPITVPYLPEHFPIRDCDEPRSVAANYLISLIVFSFQAPFQGIGHLGARDIIMYRTLLTVTQRGYHSPFVSEYNRAQIRTTHGAYVDPRAVWFYGEYEFDLHAEDAGWPEVPGNIVTEILVPDEVAYLRINSFMACRIFDNLTTVPFLREVQDFDHLILDIRGNLGGDMSYFVQAIYIPLVREAAHLNSYQFFAGGETAVAVMDAYLQLFLSLGIAEEAFYAGIHPISDVVSQRGLVQFHPDDYERLSYVLVSQELVNPDAIPDEMRIPFEGEIWLLVDEMSMSASVAAAMLAISSGFATVVGENTSGVTAGYHVYIVLPNTGIIWRVDIGSHTDDYGRSIEEHGVTPQIRNLPGMDALETVLALIAQGNDNDEYEYEYEYEYE